MDHFVITHPSFVVDVDKAAGTVFKTLNNRIVIGRRVGSKRWLLEGVFREGRSQMKEFVGSSSTVKLTEVHITEIVAQEGTISFDAMPLKVECDEEWHLIVLLLPLLHDAAKSLQEYYQEDIKNLYLSHVVMHETYHVLTERLLVEPKGELNDFKSELLADTSLIRYINGYPNRTLHLDIKRRDVARVLASREWTSDMEYYKMYLELMGTLLDLSDQRKIHLKAEVLTDLLVKKWEGNTFELYATLMTVLDG